MKSRRVLILVFSSLFATGAWAYDSDLAAKFAPTLERMDQAALAKAGSKLTMDNFLAAYAKKEKMTILDIRTPAETRLVSIPGALQIPLDKLMNKDNLDQLPTEEKIVVVCHSGARAGIATVLLRMIGFNNAVFLDGGASALAHAATPKALPLE
jgi:rhodanese-related sulfurtransferase